MDQDAIIKFIQVYAAHPTLWNPRHEDYYSKVKRDAVWDQIAKTLETPKQELVVKMRNMQGAYRKERNREKKSIDLNRPYKSKWYAYEHFSFLRDKQTDDPLATETEELSDRSYLDIPCSDDEDGNTDEYEDSQYTSPVPPSITNNLKRKRYTIDTDTIQANPSTADNPQKLENDPYTTFGLYIAAELRKYDAFTLAHVKHAINNVIFQADTKFYLEESKKNNSNVAKNTTPIINIKSENDNDDDPDYE